MCAAARCPYGVPPQRWSPVRRPPPPPPPTGGVCGVCGSLWSSEAQLTQGLCRRCYQSMRGAARLQRAGELLAQPPPAETNKVQGPPRSVNPPPAPAQPRRTSEGRLVLSAATAEVLRSSSRRSLGTDRPSPDPPPPSSPSPRVPDPATPPPRSWSAGRSGGAESSERFRRLPAPSEMAARRLLGLEQEEQEGRAAIERDEAQWRGFLRMDLEEACQAGGVAAPAAAPEAAAAASDPAECGQCAAAVVAALAVVSRLAAQRASWLAAFRMADGDCSGHISVKELAQGLRDNAALRELLEFHDTPGHVAGEIAEIAQAVDRDADGIEWDEYVAMLDDPCLFRARRAAAPEAERAPAGPHAALGATVRSVQQGAHTLSDEELEEHWRQAFALIDRSNDGRLQTVEVLLAIQNVPGIRELLVPGWTEEDESTKVELQHLVEILQGLDDSDEGAVGWEAFRGLLEANHRQALAEAAAPPPSPRSPRTPRPPPPPPPPPPPHSGEDNAGAQPPAAAEAAPEAAPCAAPCAAPEAAPEAETQPPPPRRPSAVSSARRSSRRGSVDRAQMSP
eukprot:TRINITY_DN21842_c0_g4_i3.p1 TRINITY_DN21842_c0_g4~~TRINITY_DN21842_c0_g4_i3.p1  ORF type:complete len:565 (+),score=151.54 TRINITY_DN21842_c0_g4_i3:84-1778(+)